MANEQNLIPAKKGEPSRNPAGRPKGNPNLSTIIKNLLEQGEMDWKKVPLQKNAEHGKMYGKRGWLAIVYVATAQAMSGNIQAMEWLRKAQYGNPPQALLNEEGSEDTVYIVTSKTPRRLNEGNSE